MGVNQEEEKVGREKKEKRGKKRAERWCSLQCRGTGEGRARGGI